MAKSENAMNDSALESAAGGAYGVVKENGSTFDLCKDDGTYIGTYGIGDSGIEAAGKILKTYGNNAGALKIKLVKKEDLDNGSGASGGFADRIKKLYKK